MVDRRPALEVRGVVAQRSAVEDANKREEEGWTALCFRFPSSLPAWEEWEVTGLEKRGRLASRIACGGARWERGWWWWCGLFGCRMRSSLSAV